MTDRVLYVMTPTYRPVGGVVKIMDYVTHARAAGYRVSVHCPEKWAPTLPLFEIPRIAALATDPDVTFERRFRFAMGADDLVFLSLPDHYDVAYRALRPTMSPARIIHIIQNVRHTTVTWRGGGPLRWLTRPASRISINDVVARRIEPWLDQRGLHEVIPLGHDIEFFRSPDRGDTLHRPLRVGYTTWKSSVGDEVAAVVPAEHAQFRAVRETATWAELRDLYSWADVFLCSPGPEEGLYLPGVEAMAAGCLVITPDAGGNMAYCRPEENCLLVGFEDADGYVDALDQLAHMTPERRNAMRSVGVATAATFSLDQERSLFTDFLTKVWDHVEQTESPRLDVG